MKKIFAKLLIRSVGLYYNFAALIRPKKIARKAFVLFCTPRKGRVLPEQKSFLTNAKDDIIDCDGIQLQTYHWPGDGPTLLLVHGWESNTNRWRDVIAELQKENFNIIAFDAPAHGYSSGSVLNVPLYADCTQKIIEAHQPKYIVGHSIGGMTMLYNQYKYRNTHIEKMVSLGAPSELSDFMRQYQNILGLNKKMMAHLESYFVEVFGFKFAEFSSPKFAKSIATSGLLIHDKLDRIAPYRCSVQVHKSWTNSILITTKGLGHSLHQDKVRRQLINFLKS